MKPKSTLKARGWNYTAYPLEDGQTLNEAMKELREEYESNENIELDSMMSYFTPKHDALTCPMHLLNSTEGTHGVEIKWRMKHSD